MPKITYKIVNIVAMTDVSATLDLYNLALALENVEYEPEQFPGAIMRIKEPKGSLLLFKTGKIIIPGQKDTKSIVAILKKAFQLIKKANKNFKKPKKIKYEITNFVATSKISEELNLYNLTLALENIEYEPEQFPGAIMRIPELKVSSLLFRNGTMIIAGAKSKNTLEKALRKIYNDIKRAKKAKIKF